MTISDDDKTPDPYDDDAIELDDLGLIAPDVHAAEALASNEFTDEPATVTEELTKPEDTRSLRVCTLCAGPVAVFLENSQPPDPDEAWKLPGCMVTPNPRGHHWCRTRGKLWLPSDGILAEYDRRRSDVIVSIDRRAPRSVDDDRRRALPPGIPMGGK